MDAHAALTAFEDQNRRQMTVAIRRRGVFNTYVADGPGSDCACCRAVPTARSTQPPVAAFPAFCYSTGLFGVGHPELLVFGLDMSRANRLLTALAHDVRHDHDLTPGELVEGQGLTLVVEQVPNPGEIFFAANDYYRRPPEHSVPGLQLTWADDAGRFPWDAGSLGDPADQPRPGRFRA